MSCAVELGGSSANSPDNPLRLSLQSGAVGHILILIGETEGHVHVLQVRLGDHRCFERVGTRLYGLTAFILYITENKALHQDSKTWDQCREKKCPGQAA